MASIPKATEPPSGEERGQGKKEGNVRLTEHTRTAAILKDDGRIIARGTLRDALMAASLAEAGGKHVSLVDEDTGRPLPEIDDGVFAPATIDGRPDIVRAPAGTRGRLWTDCVRILPESILMDCHRWEFSIVLPSVTLGGASIIATSRADAEEQLRGISGCTAFRGPAIRKEAFIDGFTRGETHGWKPCRILSSHRVVTDDGLPGTDP